MPVAFPEFVAPRLIRSTLARMPVETPRPHSLNAGECVRNRYNSGDFGCILPSHARYAKRRICSDVGGLSKLELIAVVAMREVTRESGASYRVRYGEPLKFRGDELEHHQHSLWHIHLTVVQCIATRRGPAVGAGMT